ncbi:NlpC/P60 family protein [Corynebacterium lactis]|uniref:Endopeptidase n=1 Tax=Corynebacterium lactis RW2-5 TaxID=1408189 RepID=A0A0K2H0U8_9CORY|nr:NlpC/P60 family protein [Corynebacterium lactis]ALA67665.1 endopeptidase [Corynebacterium lactis RW2-5]
MGKHHRRSNFARNAAAFGATVASVTALAVPAASANPLNDIQGVLGGFDSPQVPGVQQIVGQFSNFGGGDITSAAQSTGAKIVDAARSQIGTPYVWGGSQPGGFDCSGLTSWAYQQVGKSIPRTSQAQASSGSPVSSPDLGDIVSFYSGATHVGIFSGNGNVIHAPQTGDVVKEAPMNYMPVHNIVRF